ncbi:MAG: pilus assembly protein PilM [Gammaproteobacteria bacterium]
MALRFRTCPQSLLALTFYREKICLIELAYIRETWQLLACEALTHSENLDEAALIDAILRIISHSKTQCQRVAIAIEHPHALIKLYRLDASLSHAEIAHYLNIQQQTLNIPQEELATDFACYPHHQQQELMPIQWVAVRQHLIKSWLNIFSKTPLSLVLVEMDSCSLLRIGRMVYADQPVAVLHIDEKSVLMGTIDHHGYNNFQQKSEISADNTSKWQNIADALRYYLINTNKLTVNKIVLSSAQRLNSADVEQLASLMERPCEMMNPFKPLSISQRLKSQILHHSPEQFCLSVGLAMRIKDLKSYGY